MVRLGALCFKRRNLCRQAAGTRQHAAICSSSLTAHPEGTHLFGNAAGLCMILLIHLPRLLGQHSQAPLQQAPQRLQQHSPRQTKQGGQLQHSMEDGGVLILESSLQSAM